MEAFYLDCGARRPQLKRNPLDSGINDPSCTLPDSQSRPCCSGGKAFAQEPHVAPNAPKDQPQTLDSLRWAQLDSATAPLVAQARLTYPGAKRRYSAGLPAGQSFFLTTRLRDSLGNREQVFVAVDSIRGDRVFGRIWSDITVVRGYRLHQPISFLESAIVDWLITKPDGSEEGNIVGKFLDTYRPPH